MAKPIAVIYFPETFENGRINSNFVYEFMRFLNDDQRDDATAKWERSDKFTDYHWFCFWKFGIEAPEFQVFHEKDFTEIQYQELKELIEQSIHQSKTEQ